MAKYGSRKESNACCTLTYYSNDDDDGLLNEVPKNLEPYLRVRNFSCKQCHEAGRADKATWTHVMTCRAEGENVVVKNGVFVRAARFLSYNIPKRGKMYQIYVHKIDQMGIKYFN
jgi:hypothetical protein